MGRPRPAGCAMTKAVPATAAGLSTGRARAAPEVAREAEAETAASVGRRRHWRPTRREPARGGSRGRWQAGAAVKGGPSAGVAGDQMGQDAGARTGLRPPTGALRVVDQAVPQSVALTVTLVEKGGRAAATVSFVERDAPIVLAPAGEAGPGARRRAGAAGKQRGRLCLALHDGVRWRGRVRAGSVTTTGRGGSSETWQGDRGRRAPPRGNRSNGCGWTTSTEASRVRRLLGGGRRRYRAM